MQSIFKIFSSIILIGVLLLSILFVLLNSQSVQVDFWGLHFSTQSLGILVICAFALGVAFSLALMQVQKLFSRS